MKKLIQICSLFSLLFVFSVISAYSQSDRQYKAQIPFDFSIGQNTYAAGSYVIKISRLAGSGLTLSLADTAGKRLEILFVSDNGVAGNGNPKLVFNRYGNQRFLSKLQTEEMTVSISMSKGEKFIADKIPSEDSVDVQPNR